jgi:uncharacterized membrane protein YfcA
MVRAVVIGLVLGAGIAFFSYQAPLLGHHNWPVSLLLGAVFGAAAGAGIHRRNRSDG